MTRVSQTIDRIDATFDDPNLVANAGLLAFATVSQRLGLEALIDSMVRLVGRVGGARPGRKVLTLVHAIIAGASHIDHVDVLRAGSTEAVLGHRVMAPSTIGTFLRAFERRTKTGSKGHRTIAVDAETLRAVDELRERQAELAAEHELPEPVYVFSFDAGVTPWRPDYLSMAFGRLSKRKVRLHDLRHYHATQLLSAGVPVATVSKRLGHTSTAVTLNTYSHWLPEQDREAADVMARLLAG